MAFRESGAGGAGGVAMVRCCGFSGTSAGEGVGVGFLAIGVVFD